MKNNFHIFITLCLLAAASIVNGQNNPDVLRLDSVYTYGWVNNNWSLTLKDYAQKNGSGQRIDDLFLKYNADSAKFLNYARFLYTYLASDSIPKNTTNQFWYSNNWVNYEYTHNLTKNVVDTTYFKEWNNQKDKFIYGQKNTYQYNDSLLQIESILQMLDTSTQSTVTHWLNTSKITNTYTSDGKPLEQIQFAWQNSSSTWVNVYKSTNVYNLNNLLISRMEYEWADSTSSWNESVRTTYFNNSSSLVYLTVKEYWNSTQLKWDTLQQTTYLYSPLNWLFTVQTQTYQQSTGHWVNSTLTYYSYYPSGGQQTMTGNIWDTLHSAWVTTSYQRNDSLTGYVVESYTRYVGQGTFQITGGSRYLYTYGTIGDTLSIVNQQWNVPAAGWVNNSQILYTYNSHNLLTEQLTQSWTTSNSTWGNTKKSDYYYSNYGGIIEHQANTKPCLYANPMLTGNPIYCPDFETGSNYTLKVCSLTGMEVYRINFTGGEAVKISRALSPGLYFLIIEEKNNILYKDKVVILN